LRLRIRSFVVIESNEQEVSSLPPGLTVVFTPRERLRQLNIREKSALVSVLSAVGEDYLPIATEPYLPVG